MVLSKYLITFYHHNKTKKKKKMRNIWLHTLKSDTTTKLSYKAFVMRNDRKKKKKPFLVLIRLLNLTSL